MKNKTKALIISFTCGAFLVLAGFTAEYKKQADDYKRAERYAQMQSMSQLADSMHDMSDSLVLGVYAYSPELLTAAAAQIWSDALSATASLSAMPLWNSRLEKTQGFINQAGDFAYYIAHHASSGTELNGEERQQLMKLSEKTRELSESLYNAETELYSGGHAFSAENAASFEDMENGFDEFTFMEYDGALTAGVLERGAGRIAEEAEVDVETARRVACLALDCESERLSSYSESVGAIPAYVFFSDGGDVVSVTKNGGHVMTIKRDSMAGEAQVSASEAIKNGVQLLDKLGYREMVPVYYQIPDDTIHIEFVYCGGGIRAYPDKINVSVALADGTVTRVDASEYLVNHSLRENGIVLAREDEPDFLPESLSCEYVGAAIVTSPGMHELLCREYLCGDETGRLFTMYLDVESGEQRQIKIVDRTDYGTFIV